MPVGIHGGVNVGVRARDLHSGVGTRHSMRYPWDRRSRSDAQSIREVVVAGIVRTPPYGPVKGMIQGVELLRRASPAVVNEDLLQQHRIAPGNEYKALGALRFLGLIDETGQLTDRARLLKTRGATFTLNLQQIIRDAYGELFDRLDPRTASRDDVHNYFVTEVGLGAEMATKATRFLLELCKLAELTIAAGPAATNPSSMRAGAAPNQAPSGQTTASAPSFGLPVVFGMLPPIVLALTPETARLSEDELTDLLRRVQRAAGRAFEKA